MSQASALSPVKNNSFIKRTLIDSKEEEKHLQKIDKICNYDIRNCKVSADYFPLDLSQMISDYSAPSLEEKVNEELNTIKRTLGIKYFSKKQINKLNLSKEVVKMICRGYFLDIIKEFLVDVSKAIQSKESDSVELSIVCFLIPQFIDSIICLKYLEKSCLEDVEYEKGQIFEKNIRTAKNYLDLCEKSFPELGKKIQKVRGELDDLGSLSLDALKIKRKKIYCPIRVFPDDFETFKTEDTQQTPSPHTRSSASFSLDSIYCDNPNQAVLDRNPAIDWNAIDWKEHIEDKWIWYAWLGLETLSYLGAAFGVFLLVAMPPIGPALLCFSLILLFYGAHEMVQIKKEAMNETKEILEKEGYEGYLGNLVYALEDLDAISSGKKTYYKPTFFDYVRALTFQL